uniref:RING-type domain-containing protein n=1 Tax=Acrobeloides nanus TaxID=290746 RepID=A0A914DPQ7_9BILA
MLKFLENNITFGELTLKLGTETLAHIMQNPKLLVSLQHFPVIMLINSYQRRDYTIEELLKFIENNPVPENQLSLELSGNNCRDDFGSRLIDTFMSHKNPSKMIRQVTAESWNFHVLKIITVSNLTGMATTNNATVLKDNEGMEYYELKRKDDLRKKVLEYKSKQELENLEKEVAQDYPRSETSLTNAEMGIEIEVLKLNLKNKKLLHENSVLKSNQASFEKGIQQLKIENEQLKMQILCTICLAQKRQVIFMPCCHFVACGKCSQISKHCNICHAIICGKIKVHQ